MKLTRRQLQEIIQSSLLSENDLLLEDSGTRRFLAAAIQKLGEEGAVSEEIALAAQKGVEHIYNRGSKQITKELVGSSRAMNLMRKAGMIGGTLGTAAAMFGAFSLTAGVFSVLPKMISRTIDNLSTIQGSFLNFYKIKNISAIRTGKGHSPIKWSEYGDSTGAAAEIVSNFGVKIRTKNEIATVLAASKMTGNPKDDIMAQIEKAGRKKYGSDDDFEMIFDPSFYKEVGKRVKALRKTEDLPATLLRQVLSAVKAEDRQGIKAFVDIIAAIT